VLAAQFGKIASLEVVEGQAIDLSLAAAKYGELFELMLWGGLASGVVFLLLTPLARRWMHGVR
jgi:proton-dependent oligopeptide transporter, POT family